MTRAVHPSLLNPAQPAARAAMDPSARWFITGAFVLAAAALFLAGWAPLGFSIVTVFLFAGPHNWFEFRYFLSRMPARWGPRRAYFLTGLVGALALTVLFIGQTLAGRILEWSPATWAWTSATWNGLLIAWVAAMIHMRRTERGHRDHSLLWAVACAACGLALLHPTAWSIGMVYLHPVIALWFLDAELKRRHSTWLRPYRLFLAALPVMLIVLWWQLAGSPNLPGHDALSWRITHHAGAGLFSGISTHLLVSTHTFLETLHYGVWMIAIPLAARRGLPWNVSTVPLAKKSMRWRRLVFAVPLVGAIIVLALWACFLADYPLTRDVYFTIAILHVLAEFPFLIRAS